MAALARGLGCAHLLADGAPEGGFRVDRLLLFLTYTPFRKTDCFGHDLVLSKGFVTTQVLWIARSV